MSYDEIIKAITRGEKIYDLPLRVTYYCRVSTDSDIQLNSLDNQTEYYINFIKSKSNWTFVEGYIEEGVSGVRVDKRTNFKRMIRDAQLNKFDLIITKEVSRFARDLEDSIHYIRELKSCGVGVFFENQNLSTFDENSELILNIMFNLAQDESKKLSNRVKFGYRQAIKKGHVLGSSNITGYKKENCKLVMVEEEATFIRKVFELYATGEYGFHKLARKLSKLGYYNKEGRIYDKQTLERMISNPKYKGFYRAHEYEIMDYRTKRRRAVPLEEQTIYKCENNEIPPIVSEELWDKANEIRNTRSESYKNNNYWSGGLKYPFSSKIYCKEHNTNFQRSHGSRKKNRPTWSCGLYLQYGIDACLSPIIAEKDLNNIMDNVMQKIIPQKNKIVEDMLELYKNIDKTNQYDVELDNVEKDIKTVEDKKTFALDLVFSGELKREELKTQFDHYEKEINNLNKKKQEILKQKEILNESYDNIDKMSKSIQEEIDGGSLEDFIRNFVEEIIVSKINDNRYDLKLDIFLNLFGDEKPRTKGARHINGATDNEMLYLENQVCPSIEELRANCQKNNFTYNVYVETL